MDCSRCGGELETYALGDKEAYVCGDCGFVDTPVEHEATPRPEPEPWAKALERFHEKYVKGDVAIVGSGETAALVEIDGEETGDDDSDEEAIDDDTDAQPDEADADDTDAEPSEETGSGSGETDAEPDEIDSEETDSDADDSAQDSETIAEEEADESSDDVDGRAAGDTVEEREKPA